MCFVKILTVRFVFGSPVETVIVFPPAKHALRNSVSLNVFARKVTSAVIVGHSSKDLQIIY